MDIALGPRRKCPYQPGSQDWKYWREGWKRTTIDRWNTRRLYWRAVHRSQLSMALYAAQAERNYQEFSK